MRKYILCVVLFGIFWHLTGCYVRFEENEGSPYHEYIGKYAETTIDIVIMGCGWGGLFGRMGVPDDVTRRINYRIGTLPAGSVIKITGISSRRLKSGKHHYLECLHDADGEKITFDYPIRYILIKKGYLNFKAD
jgi:hypothetical protein